MEDMRVQTLPHMQRLFALVVEVAHFVFHVMETWPPVAVTWLRLLGGKLGCKLIATLTLLVLEPFPHHAFESP